MASHERERGYVNDALSEENNITSPTESAFGFSSSGSSYYSSPSDFSSPLGSEMGSTETESEDDDFIAELSQLTRRMAEYTIQDDEDEFQQKSLPDTVSKKSEVINFIRLLLSLINFLPHTESYFFWFFHVEGKRFTREVAQVQL